MQRRELCFALILFCFLCPGFARAQNPVLEGYVMNSATGRPIAEARVKLSRPDAEPLYTKTDANGRFEFPNAGPGYSIQAERPGFLQSRIQAAGARFRRVGPIRIDLPPYAVITGKITDPNGLPIAGCPVEILQKRPVSGPQPGSPLVQPLPGGEYAIARTNGARTNDLGEFRAAQLGAGTYYVVANKTGRQTEWPGDYRITYYPGGLDLASAKPIEIAAGQEFRADIQILRREGVRVRGRLTGPGMEATPPGRMRYTRLMLIPQDNHLMNANGPFAMARSEEFEFTDVLPGQYTLVAVTSERPASDIWGGDDKPAFGITRPVEIKDRGMEGLSVPLEPLREIAGVVTFNEGCTPVPVRITVSNDSQLAAGQQPQTLTGADGKFVLSGLSPGILRLAITNPALPGFPVIPQSARLGEREVLRDGLAYPFQGNESLRIVVGCTVTTNWRPL